MNQNDNKYSNNYSNNNGNNYNNNYSNNYTSNPVARYNDQDHGPKDGVEPHKVVAVKKDSWGNLTHFKLDDGRVLDFEQCREAIHNGELPDLICTVGKTDQYKNEKPIIIRSQPDGDVSNNLGNLPLF